MFVKKVVVVGGGSAGFLAAITLKVRHPQLDVAVIRAKDIGIIGVGEASTGQLVSHLHEYLGIDQREFYLKAEPVWKLGIRFIWGSRGMFDYSFNPQFNVHFPQLSRPVGYFCDQRGPIEYAGLGSALMSQNMAFARDANDQLLMQGQVAYHLENVTFVRFLEEYAQHTGVRIIEDRIVEVSQNDSGVSDLRLASGGSLSADLYIDCSGFISLLLGKTLKEPFVPFASSLYCDRAIHGGWDREDEPIQPYTTAETMDCGWCWRIDHEKIINRGYVHCSAFISESDAEAEFRRKNPKVKTTRTVKFVTGRYERAWVKNVVAIGNAGGFVEPLESTGLGAICVESQWLANGLAETDLEIRPILVKLFNRRVNKNWDSIRSFLTLHYKYNTRLNTPFWRECFEKADLAGAADMVEYYRQTGPSLQWWFTLLDRDDQFTAEGHLAVLIGQSVPYKILNPPTASERTIWERIRQSFRTAALKGFSVTEALERVKSPEFQWPRLR